MKKLRECIKSGEDFKKFTDMIVLRVGKGEAVSDAPMVDGLIIGFIVSTYSFTQDLVLDKYMGRVLDGTMQKLEQISIWLCNNEGRLIKLYNDLN